MTDTEELIITECLICQKPLGSESRDLGIPVCHEHRKCSKCGRDVQLVEIEYCLKNKYPITHARELALSDQTLDTNAELSNLARLLLWPDPSLNRQTLQQRTTTQFNLLVNLLNHEQILLIIDQAQALAAAGSLAIAKNRREIEISIQEKEAKKHKKAAAERVEASKTPADKKAESAYEIEVKTFEKLGMPRSVAEMMVKRARESRKDMLK